MYAWTWVAHHRYWALALGFVLVAALVIVGLWYFLLRTPATRVDLRQALRLYRKSQVARILEVSPRLPPPGVYRYRTSGGEHLSIGGISRSFPADSDMIVTDTACATFDWEPLEQHTEGLVVCPLRNGALDIKSALSYEVIAGTTTTSLISCPVDTYFVPPHPTVNERWHRTCHSKTGTTVISGHVVGDSSVTVGAHKEPALHTRLTLTFSGSQSGTNPNDYWISLQDGLILRQRESVDVAEKAGPFGSVQYTEKMGISLLSTVAIR